MSDKLRGKRNLVVHCLRSGPDRCVAMTAVQMMSLVDFSTLAGFPELKSEEKIDTRCFLDASREIVGVIESFGKLFFPVVKDMRGNIEKLSKFFVQDEEKYRHLEDMIASDMQNGKSLVVDALLWLKRALELLEKFFRNVLNDVACEESLKIHMRLAYEEALQPFHGIIIQKTCSVIHRFVPSRSALLGKDAAHQQQNVKALETFLPNLRAHLERINSFYTANGLNRSDKV